MLSSSDVELAVEVLETVGGCELWLTIRLEETELGLVIDSESRLGVIGLGIASLEVIVLFIAARLRRTLGASGKGVRPFFGRGQVVAISWGDFALSLLPIFWCYPKDHRGCVKWLVASWS